MSVFMIYASGAQDMGWLERGLRAAVLGDACGLLEQLLNDPEVQVPEDRARPGEKVHQGRARTVLSIFGRSPCASPPALWR